MSNLNFRVIGYARVSTEEQGAEGHSLAEQVARIRAYVRCHPDIELVDIITEVGSGKDMNRPGLLKALARLDDHGIVRAVDAIVVVDLDRLTRNLHNLIQMVEGYFKPKGEGGLISISENLDLATPTGRMLVYFIGLIAQWQRERISEHSKRTVAHLKTQGKRFNAHPPYGLMVNPDNPAYLIDSPEERRTLGKIKRMRESGCSLRDIAFALESSQRFNRKGNPFTISAISKMCRKNGFHDKRHETALLRSGQPCDICGETTCRYDQCDKCNFWHAECEACDKDAEKS
tara:strand:+ start:1104 stop:1967 length:864 start_codon:yes stop_codon:yes gene_type:complete